MYKRQTLNIAVIVRVFKTGLQRIVIDIGDAQLSFDTRHTHGFEFQVSHGAGGVLRQGLIDSQADSGADGQDVYKRQRYLSPAGTPHPKATGR